MYIIRDQAGQTLRISSLNEVAQIVQLDPHEIAWALEELGQCETVTHCVVVEEEASLRRTGRLDVCSTPNTRPIH